MQLTMLVEWPIIITRQPQIVLDYSKLQKTLQRTKSVDRISGDALVVVCPKALTIIIHILLAALRKSLEPAIHAIISSAI